MRIAIQANSNASSQAARQKLIRGLKQDNFEVDVPHPEVVITIGGDGTLLSAFHRYADVLDQVRFIGVHTGHLGFYTDWRDYETDDLIAALKRDSGESTSYPLLDVLVDYEDGTTAHFLALNEATLKGTSGTMRTDVYVKENFFESFRGDGLCVATPTGSTAYSKSNGGAVIHPRLAALQMTEIASINNRVFRTLAAPMILAPDEWVSLRPEPFQDYVMSIDQFTAKPAMITAIRFKVATEKIRFASYRHMHFWDRVEDAFIGEKKPDAL
ncbi:MULTISPECIES: NAD kinase [unclassified Lacticaseibacillus]|uniref:NAD kinase n=1 Tax=unclassified Lacticaseibacillus TaxID=2759744 RepID=UPI0019459472|nr:MULTISPECIES: NAD kinase [unclassified Lacticaseibacillus]